MRLQVVERKIPFFPASKCVENSRRNDVFRQSHLEFCPVRDATPELGGNVT